MLSTPDDAVMQMNLSSSCYLSSEQEPPPPPFFLNYPDEAAYLDSAGYGCWLSPEQQHSFSPPAPLYSTQVQVQQQQHTAPGKTLCGSRSFSHKPSHLWDFYLYLTNTALRTIRIKRF
jgi:hypothetical protein